MKPLRRSNGLLFFMREWALGSVRSCWGLGTDKSCWRAFGTDGHFSGGLAFGGSVAGCVYRHRISCLGGGVVSPKQKSLRRGGWLFEVVACTAGFAWVSLTVGGGEESFGRGGKVVRTFSGNGGAAYKGRARDPQEVPRRRKGRRCGGEVSGCRWGVLFVILRAAVGTKRKPLRAAVGCLSPR